MPAASVVVLKSGRTMRALIPEASRMLYNQGDSPNYPRVERERRKKARLRDVRSRASACSHTHLPDVFAIFLALFVARLTP